MDRCVFLVVTPVLNCNRFIRDCILSVKTAFAKSSYKHVIVDGGSTDGTLEIIQANAHNNLVVHDYPKSSMYQALNRGIALFKSDYFYQLNGDDLVLPESPAIVAECFSRNPSVAVVAGTCLTANIETGYCKLKVPTKQQFRINRIAANLFISQPSAFIRTSELKSVGGYSEVYKGSADTELWLRLMVLGKSFKRVIKCLSIDRLYGTCRRTTPLDRSEVIDIRRKYFNHPHILKLVKTRNSIEYLFTQAGSMLCENAILQKGSRFFGSSLAKLLGLFFSTKRAGIELDYDYFKGKYYFEGRIR